MQALAQTRHRSLIQAGEGEQVYYSFPLVLSSGLKDARAYARKKDVDTKVAFEDAAFILRPREGGECKEAKSLSMRCILFPLHPGIKGKEAAKIARVIQTLP
jgi:dTDP-4-amino-4,6-dideoxygalactose transaminase